MSHSKIDSPQVKNLRMSTLVKRQRCSNTVTTMSLDIHTELEEIDCVPACLCMYVCRMLRMQSERYYRCSRIRVCPSLARLGWMDAMGAVWEAITNRYFDPKY